MSELERMTVAGWSPELRTRIRQLAAREFRRGIDDAETYVAWNNILALMDSTKPESADDKYSVNLESE